MCWFGPYISASKMPTLKFFAKFIASNAVIVLFPTPPLAEATDIIFLILI